MARRRDRPARAPSSLVWRPRRGRAVAAVAVAGALGAGGCRPGGNMPVELRDPDGVLADSTWAHVLVFDGSCPPLADVVLGTYQQPRYEQIAEADGGFDDIGSLSAGRVGFALVARSSSCQVVGVGCTNADLRDVDRVDIVVGRVYDSSSRTACEAQCVEGRCATGTTNQTSAAAEASGPF